MATHHLSDRPTDAFGLLEACGAGAIPHPGGMLLDHLQRTAQLLNEWDASEEVVLAGLCHAVYGTDGFDHPLVDLSCRADVAGVVGPDAEAVVYRYASCDRRFTFPHLGRDPVKFRDRFTGEVDAVEPTQLQEFMELTFANELDVVRHSPGFATGEWPLIARVFSRCRDLVSGAAWAGYLGTRRTEGLADG